MYGTVAGMYEKRKHLSPLEAAQFELEEEALRTSEWYPLLSGDDNNTTAPLDKYSTNRFHAYLLGAQLRGGTSAQTFRRRRV